MKTIITADIHNGYPRHVDYSLWTMKVMREYARKHDIGLVFVLGDLFHDRVNINIEVLTKVYDFFDDTDKNYNQTWASFPGNHDMFLKNSWKVNSLRPLNRLLNIYEDVKLVNIEESRFWILPFVHFESTYMEILKKVENQHQEGDVLLTHIGVNSATLNACFLIQNWSVVTFEDSPFDRVYAGHFHCHQQVGKNVWYPGSPLPYRFDEGQVEHGFLVYDTETREHEFIPTITTGAELLGTNGIPPDYITITDEDLEFDRVEGNRIKIILSREYTKNELENIRESILTKGAKSVTWARHKEKDQELDIKQEQLKGAGMKSMEDLFQVWLEHDKPKDMNEELLKKLNDQISQEARELIVVEDEDD